MNSGPNLDSEIPPGPAPLLTAEIDALIALARKQAPTDPDQGEKLAKRALELSREVLVDGQHYEKGLALSSAVLGSIAASRWDYINALSWLIDAQVRLGLLDEPIIQLDVLRDLGWVYFNLGNLSQAIEILHQAIKVARDSADPIYEARILTTLGAVYGENGDKQESIDSLQRALNFLEGFNEPRLRSLILNNLAMTQFEIQDYEKALESAAQSLEFAKQIDAIELQATILDTTGQIYLARNDYASAEGYFKQALEQIRGRGNDPVEIILNLARTAEGLGQPDKALGLLNQAFESIKTRGANRFRYQYHELLARIHENRGDYPLAIEHFKNFHEIKSQVYSEETRRRLDNLVVSQQAETARIDAEIYRLKNLSLRQEVVAHRQAAAEMEILATTDSLTGLLNRRHFFTLGGYAFESARKQKQPMAVLMFDIDDFKKVNDRYGHLTGDQVLIEVSSVIHACLRKADLLCRYGGEEFVAVLPETTELAAQRAAERILKKVSRPITRKGVPGVCITLSIGIALAKTGDGDLEAALNRADQALYAAKHNGKNQAVTA